MPQARTCLRLLCQTTRGQHHSTAGTQSGSQTNRERALTENDSKNKHLEFIQGAITRMSSNSFLLKAWVVALTAGLFALSASKGDHPYASLAYFPAAAFWLLDGYYLAQERKFRNKFDHVRQISNSEIDFDMRNSSLTAAEWVSAMISAVNIVFYGVNLTTILIFTATVG